MSKQWFKDIQDMHRKFGVKKAVSEMDGDTLRKYLEFRLAFIEEEYLETVEALANNDAEEIVDGLIDLCVVAIGTLESMQVDADAAWNRVHEANMAKQVGVNESRPNELGLPDLVKPTGFRPPQHKDNIGLLVKIYDAGNLTQHMRKQGFSDKEIIEAKVD